MAKTLVIVESPTKAKTITKFLGRNCKVLSTMGHIRDLPKSKLGVDIEHNFDPQYIPIRGKGPIIKGLKAMAKGCTQILLASDPDREGEAIAWHLQQLLGVDPKENSRIEFHEITKEAITHAIKNPRPIDMDRVNAQQGRRVLDRLVGYKLSPLLWAKIKKGLSAGRVQSVALSLICQREKEIDAFISEEFWTILGNFATPKSEKFNTKLLKKANKNLVITSEDEMQNILKDIKKNPYIVTKVVHKEKKKSPPPPFTTSTLQQDGVRKLNFTAKKVMIVAQQLYEGVEIAKTGAVGLITYMRTDSVNIADSAREEAKEFIEATYGKSYALATPRFYKSKGKAQNAHEAVRPTSVARTPDELKPFLTKEQFRLYKLIWERFLATQMTEAVYDTTTADIEGNKYLFRANGNKVKFLGYRTIYQESNDDEQKEEEGKLPYLEEKMEVQLLDTEPKQHFTQPPARYSEASLVKTLEELGIGRPSTYAPTIDTILSRGYVIKETKLFMPTELGLVVVEMLKENFPEIIDEKFTAEMEESLDQVAEGEITWQEIVQKFYTTFAVQLAEAEQKISKVKIADEVSEEPCEKCGRLMVYKMGRFGKFLACPGFPECRNTKAIKIEIGVSCPVCDGKVIQRKGKKGRVFYGCSNYPTCTYTSWDKPSDKECPECNTRMVEKIDRKKEKYFVCPDKECKYELRSDEVEKSAKD